MYIGRCVIRIWSMQLRKLTLYIDIASDVVIRSDVFQLTVGEFQRLCNYMQHEVVLQKKNTLEASRVSLPWWKILIYWSYFLTDWLGGCTLQLKVPKTGDGQEVMSFRKLLLNRCQHEFETDQKEEGNFARMQEAIDSAASVSVIKIVWCTVWKMSVSRHFVMCTPHG